MQTIMWKKRKIAIIVIISIIMYLLLKKRNYEYKTETTIQKIKAETVWEFLADFSNVKKYLIPHMKDFTIINESGNYDHWKYSVSYTELLPIWPYFKTFGVGHYSILAKENNYVISTTHNICFFHGWCSKSNTTSYISQKNKQDTLYKEEIVYECPLLFRRCCNYLADFTRQIFIDNLKKYFNSK